MEEKFSVCLHIDLMHFVYIVLEGLDNTTL